MRVETDFLQSADFFKHYDLEGRGKLSVSELRACLYYNNFELSQIQKIFPPTEQERNPYLTPEEFARRLAVLRRKKEGALPWLMCT
jgi:Ca2+-binding EF-hand superfamily protein